MPHAMSDRQSWMSPAKGSVDELYAGMQPLGEEDLSALPAYRHVRLPDVGLARVLGRVGGTGRVFNLGAITLVRCVGQLTDGLPSPGDRSDVHQPSVDHPEELMTGFG